MRKNTSKTPSEYDYWKYPPEGFPQRIEWVCIAGGGLSDIQSYDLIFDQKDLNMRFPKKNKF